MWSELEARNWWRMRHTDGIVSLSKSGYADVAIGRTFFSSLPCKGGIIKAFRAIFPTHERVLFSSIYILCTLPIRNAAFQLSMLPGR